MIAFFAGVYFGGAVVDGATSLFIGMSKKESALGAALWPYNLIGMMVKLVRR